MTTVLACRWCDAILQRLDENHSNFECPHCDRPHPCAYDPDDDHSCLAHCDTCREVKRRSGYQQDYNGPKLKNPNRSEWS